MCPDGDPTAGDLIAALEAAKALLGRPLILVDEATGIVPLAVVTDNGPA